MDVRKKTKAEAKRTQDAFDVSLEMFGMLSGMDKLSSLYVFLDLSYAIMAAVDPEVTREIALNIADPNGYEEEKLYSLFKDLVAALELKKMESARD